MDDRTFLLDAPRGNLVVQIQSPDDVLIFEDICYDILESNVPSLVSRITNYTATEDTANPSLGKCLIFNKESKSAAISLLRYAYLLDYRASDALIDQPCSLLFHLQMFRMGERYDIPELQIQARCHYVRELEFACSVKHGAIDLCQAIRFVYLELDLHEDLKEYLAHFCVHNFVYHELGQSEEFRQTVYESPQFYRLLHKTNSEQDFRAEGAPQILQLQTCSHPAHTSFDRHIVHAADFMCSLHTDKWIQTPESSKKSSSRLWNEPSKSSAFVLVERPKFTYDPIDPRPFGSYLNSNYPHPPHPSLAERLKDPPPLPDPQPETRSQPTNNLDLDWSDVNIGSSDEGEQLETDAELDDDPPPPYGSDEEWEVIHP